VNEREGNSDMQVDRKRIKVLVVDDSAVMRRLVASTLESDGDIEVVATAIDGDFALSKIEQLKPDVITLDVDMPRMDGMLALRHIVSRYGIPVIMLSSLTSKGAECTMRALSLGAVDFICKPKGMQQVDSMAEELILKVKGAARNRLSSSTHGLAGADGKRKGVPVFHNSSKVLAIGASSGGPHALRFLLSRIPVDLDSGIVIVQHMPESFTEMLARWLDEICSLDVKEASDGDAIGSGRVLIAPSGAHMKVKRTALGGKVVLERGGVVNGHMPSVDVLFNSVAEEYGAYSYGLLMTGMGSDGAQGLGEVKRVGGHTIAQDAESCSVFGMPRVAIEKGYACKVVKLSEMADHLISVVGQSCNTEGCHAGD
jgi:two-component system, chemotaxis family, protein-glutamate methylesterase/glutaminase